MPFMLYLMQRINAIFVYRTLSVSPVVVMLRAPCRCFPQKCHVAARRGCRVNREVVLLKFVARNAIMYRTRRRTRCCDAQGAECRCFAQKCHLYRPRVCRVNREVSACVFRINAISVVPVVYPLL